MLEANPELGYRDVQNIPAMSAGQTGSAYGSAGLSPELASWGANDADNWNGGGATYNLAYGYGMVDVYAAVRMAEAWSLFYDAPMTSGNQTDKEAAGLTYSATNEVTTSGTYTGPNVNIPDLGTSADVDPNALTVTITDDITIETIYVTVEVTHSWGGDLVMWLISPEGEETPFFINETDGYQIAGVKDNSSLFFPNDDRMDAGFEWTFEVGVYRGASSAGDWQLRIDDTISLDTGFVSGFSLEFFGSEATDNDVYHFTDDFMTVAAVDAERLVINGDGTDENDDTTIDSSVDWMNLVAVTGDVVLDLSATSGNLSVGGVTWATIVAGSMENVAAGDGNDAITGDGETNHIYGGRGNDTLTAMGGDDFVFGEAGDDTLIDGAGSDRYDGGAGLDRLVFSGNQDEFVFSLLDGNLLATHGGSTDTISANVETLEFGDGSTLDVASLMSPTDFTLAVYIRRCV